MKTEDLDRPTFLRKLKSLTLWVDTEGVDATLLMNMVWVLRRILHCCQIHSGHQNTQKAME